MDSVIAPSILSADFARLGQEVESVLESGADWIHIDVMDNHFVPNLTIGPMVCKALRNYGISSPLDVHLMVQPVDRLIGDFIEAGATTISFHPEASEHVDRTINLIRENGCSPGIVLNPATPLTWLDYTIDSIDLILVMSVNPGFGGQKFIPYVLNKIKQVKSCIDNQSRPIRLQVDGGVKVDNIGTIARAGANAFVAGSAIFGSECYEETIRLMRYEISTAS